MSYHYYFVCCTLTYSGDLARDAIRDDLLDARSQALYPLPLAHGSSKDIVSSVKSVDLERYLAVVRRDEAHRSNADSDLNPMEHTPSSSPSNAEELEQIFLPKGNTYSSQARKQVRYDIDRLFMDLLLAKIVLYNEPIIAAGSTTTPPVHASGQGIDNPEDLFARTEQLSLNDKADRLPPVRLSFLLPQASLDLGDGDDEAAMDRGGLGRPDQSSSKDAFQRTNVRSLLAEWDIGNDPADYQWKSWVTEGATSNSLTSPMRTQRPIRPLPASPRASQYFQPQPNVPSQSYPQSQPQPQPQPTSLTASRFAPPSVLSQIQTHAQTLPSLRPSTSLTGMNRAPMMRSSPPPAVDMMASSQVPMDSQGYQGMASTQVERGPFGGRPEKAKKKAGKKRVGGF